MYFYLFVHFARHRQWVAISTLPDARCCLAKIGSVPRFPFLSPSPCPASWGACTVGGRPLSLLCTTRPAPAFAKLPLLCIFSYLFLFSTAKVRKIVPFSKLIALKVLKVIPIVAKGHEKAPIGCRLSGLYKVHLGLNSGISHPDAYYCANELKNSASAVHISLME